MTILALEFSSDRRGVAVLRDGTVRSELVHEGTRETPIFSLIARALVDAGLTRGEVGCIAVGLGPGSYTGVRLAISVAQGWQLGTGVQTVGVSSLENMAAVAANLGPVLLAVDSQRNEFAVVEAEGGRLAGAVRLLSAADVATRMAAGERVVGPDRLPGFEDVQPVYPGAVMLARLAMGRTPVAAEDLTPIYLREASYAKAPPARRVEWRIPVS